jgi:hypothetical protein
MIKYILLFLAVFVSFFVKFYFYDINNFENNGMADFSELPNTVVEAENYFANHFKHAPLVSTFDKGIVVLEFLSLSTLDTHSILERGQILDRFRLHSVSIIPSNDDNTYDIFITYASS